MQEWINPPWSSSHPATHIWQVGASLEFKLWTHRSVAPPFFNPGSYRRESISSNLLLMPLAPLEYMSYVTSEHVRRCKLYFVFFAVHLFAVYFCNTRSCTALRAADLDWIVGPGHSWGGYILGCSQFLASCLRHSARIGPDLTLFVTDAGSQLTFEMGEGAGQE